MTPHRPPTSPIDTALILACEADYFAGRFRPVAVIRAELVEERAAALAVLGGKVERIVAREGKASERTGA